MKTPGVITPELPRLSSHIIPPWSVCLSHWLQPLMTMEKFPYLSSILKIQPTTWHTTSFFVRSNILSSPLPWPSSRQFSTLSTSHQSISPSFILALIIPPLPWNPTPSLQVAFKDPLSWSPHPSKICEFLCFTTCGPYLSHFQPLHLHDPPKIENPPVFTPHQTDRQPPSWDHLKCKPPPRPKLRYPYPYLHLHGYSLYATSYHPGPSSETLWNKLLTPMTSTPKF